MSSPARDQQLVPDLDLVHGDRLEFLARPAVRQPGRPVGQCSKIAFGPAACQILKDRSAGIHDRDDDSREGFAENQRRRHRNERDCIDAKSAYPEIAKDGEAEDGDDGQRRGGPDDF